ncbi:NAD(P)/FAD-dependent oxidoreductase [Paludifilum halophilum]|uniref:FAD-dependent oxidoreductase n=1 Tax=Paludifilum halophilum TaxID=1642702 RepID=A0A235B4B7_9BACL|nr:FAD-binding oxidoreductase [Paludifilum halophilum]OYD07123.1 FAD-dependent oxidoreductase [Paludifilum halophilum]
MKVVIVGAGIVGASAAYVLAKQGTEVVLVDREDQGQATAAGAGIVSPWISHRSEDADWYRLASAGARYYHRLVSQLSEDGEVDFGFSRVGALAVSRDTEELDRIEAQAYTRKTEAPEIGDITRMKPGEANRHFPPLDRDLGAVHITGAARVDGHLLRESLKRAARKHGVQVRKGDAQPEMADSRMFGVRVHDEKIEADAVVAASGAWASQMLEPLGVKVPVAPQRGQIMHLQLLGDIDTSRWPVVLPTGSHYMLAFDDSRVVVGATREDDTGFDYRITAGGMAEVLNEALAVAPGLADSTVYETRIGFRPVTRDLLPLLGTAPQLSGLVMATGLGPSGLTMGPYVGSLAASLALGESPALDLAPYDPLRNPE